MPKLMEEDFLELNDMSKYLIKIIEFSKTDKMYRPGNEAKTSPLHYNEFNGEEFRAPEIN